MWFCTKAIAIKSLKEVVHFYNTRDNVCPTPNDPNAKKTCWPAPEVTANEDPTVGNLGLSDQDVNDIVAFMQTPTDGYTTTNPDITARMQRNTREIRKNILQQKARDSMPPRSHRSAN